MEKSAHQAQTTFEELLKMESENEAKYELVHGEVFDRAGGSSAHNRIIFNLSGSLFGLLKNSCSGYSSDMRIFVEQYAAYLFPDLSVVCGKEITLEDRDDVLINPTLIFEVLSNSTEAYDRGLKFEMYRSIRSITDYIMIAQNKPHVEHYLRTDLGWMLKQELKSVEELIEIPNISSPISLQSVYKGVLPLGM